MNITFNRKEIKKSYLDNTELSFYLYYKDEIEIIDSQNLHFDEIEKYFNTKNHISNFELDITKKEYVEKITKIKQYITEGDTYQINFTTKAKFNFDGVLASLFLNGIFNQSAGYSVLINTENNFILSFSPELFFKTDYKTIISKPMKGTLKRIANPEEDKKLVDSILHDEKNLAENVMIVDLLRNDIGRIAETDSVKVSRLYEVEKYETLYQLTSTIKGQLKQNKLSEIIKNLFPSGSITGAPKIRSMQIIAELEKSSRNLYTGSIGIFTNKEATFNIPIRTVTIDKKTNRGEIGLGSGIVWDSDAEKEFDEVLLKGKFISEQKEYFELLETLLWENGNYFLLDYHLKRLRKSADYFLFNFDQEKIATELKNISSNLNENVKYKVRLLLNKWGSTKIEYSEIAENHAEANVALSRKIRCENEKFLYHKTTYRPWDEELRIAKQKGFDEVLFVNEKDELLEGAISNIVIEKNGKLFTPPLSLGILNGCYRQYLIDQNLCNERLLTLEDLRNADKIFICNSVREMIEISKFFNDL
ncbi:MAG: aminodeoxychorismate synthase component I [Ignavibacteriales bacterium]|nr:aminodeoxychorismate synthase component I [Ignavibacteriales bacterium]